MPTIQANGMQLFYEASGSGEPLLLIGGLGCDHTIWGLVAPRLASTHLVVAFDNRCIGASSGPDGPFSARDLAEDAASLMDQLGLERAHVAGHSMGGMVAQELALAHPERVSSLLLLSTAAN
ncbi:MAG TPA: alpha/beta fold hydrolase [Gemmataceae bacterium]|jgi:pimeloyl-ACP methyl ester carboxylesterase|nr:alpha/beta fold hydrolase [Gemmataceae bacterium]